MDVRVGPERKLSAEELMLLNCGVGEDSWESLGLQGDQTSLILKEISPEYSLEGLKLKPPILWQPDAKNWLIGKDPDAGKDWGQEEKGTTEDETVGWHHRLDGHGFVLTLVVGDAIQPSHPLSSPSPPTRNPSQHQSLFQWVNSSHEVAKVLEFQL